MHRPFLHWNSSSRHGTNQSGRLKEKKIMSIFFCVRFDHFRDEIDFLHLNGTFDQSREINCWRTFMGIITLMFIRSIDTIDNACIVGSEIWKEENCMHVFFCCIEFSLKIHQTKGNLRLNHLEFEFSFVPSHTFANGMHLFSSQSTSKPFTQLSSTILDHGRFFIVFVFVYRSHEWKIVFRWWSNDEQKWAVEACLYRKQKVEEK